MARNTIYPAKIICPSTAEIVHRSRLFDAIDVARQQAKVIWIAAPGGSGKTTLVSSYLEQKAVSHCWYQIDEEDRDLATFFHYLGLAGKLAAPRRKKLAPKLTPEYQHGTRAFARHFFSDISSRLKNNGLIVLDDFQLLSETDPVPSSLPCIADSLASGVSLVVLSRHLPPSSLNALIIKRQLHIIDTNMMRFSQEEWIAASKLFSATHSKNALLSLHRKLDGWIAGLVLLPDTANLSNATNTSGLGVDILDSYVAEQFLNSLDTEATELLLKVCHMPHITAESAKEVSGIAQSKRILAKLAQNNLFVLRQGNKGYTVHPLVQEYLKQRAESILSTKELRNLRYAAAKSLLKNDEYEAAADLLLELAEWQALIAVIIKHAGELFDTGRIKPLLRYIEALPAELTSCEPWIVYWKGKLSTYHDVMAALDYFDSAYVDFLENSDAAGAYTAWYAVVPLICSSLQGGGRLATWIARYDDLSMRYPEPPQALEKCAIDAVLLQAYFFSGQNPKKREQLRARLVSAIGSMPKSSTRLQMMANYAIIAAASGVREQDKAVFNELENSLADLKDDPVLYLGTALYFSISLWSLNAFDKQLELQLKALSVAKENGVTVFYSHIYTQIVIAALGLNKTDLAKKYIHKLKENISEGNHTYHSLYLTCLVMAGTHLDEYEDVDSVSEQYLCHLRRTEVPLFIIHHTLIYLYYLCERKKTTAATMLHDDLLKFCKKMAFNGQTARFYLIYARIFFDNGEYKRSNQYLMEGFTVARRDEVIACCHWPPRLMTWACQRALTAGIEISYVSKFVESNYKNLPAPSVKNFTWPWPFRIYTFGRFEVLSGKNFSILNQRAGKSFALLKILVAALGRSLTSYALKEKLYIDVGHEKASQSLDTQLHRLRKHFDNEQSILRIGDNIKLNLKYFWVDTLEFEDLVNSKIIADNALDLATRLQELYKGEYLPDDDSLDVITQREGFRSMYLDALFKCLGHMQDKPLAAINICQKALALEPLAEPLYRKLISIYLSQGNRDMAEVTLGQCRTVLKRHIDCDVSNATLSLLEGD